MQQAEPWMSSSPIREDCWDDFHKQRAVVFDHLAYLRTALYLLRQIAAFPFDKLTPDEDRIFFTMTARGLYETAVLAITKLTTDAAGDFLTLNRFRNSVLKIIRPELADAFREDLKKTKFDATATSLTERAKELRNARLAHLSLAEVLSTSTPVVQLKDLEQLADDIETAYQPLLFGASASFLPLAYDPEVRAANKHVDTDIEKILNAFARQTYALNLPETNSKVWPYHRAKMSTDELQVFNYWRRRAGLADA